MKITKLILTISFLFTASAYANEVKCDFKTSKQETETVFHQVSEHGHGPVGTYDLDDYTGIVSSSRGYVVISFFHKETKQGSSFHGKITDTAGLGANTASGVDWIAVECTSANP